MSMRVEQRMVMLKDIKVSDRFRKDYGDMKEFVESVKSHGVIQPITLNRNLELCAGGRRYVAAAQVGLLEVPAIIRDTDEELDLREVELFENIHRKDMTWQEEVELTNAIDRLYKDKHGDAGSSKNSTMWNNKKTADLLNKSTGYVSENIKLAQMVDAIPELKKVKNKSDALKMLKKMGRQEEVRVAAKEYQEEIKKSNISIHKIAHSNFRIGNCFNGMEETRKNYEENNTKSMISLVEVDPPYAIDLETVKKKGGMTNEELKLYKEISKENYPSFLERLCKSIYSVAAEQSWTVFWFGPTWFTEVKAALLDAGFKVDDIPGIWVKGAEGSDGAGQTNQPETYLGRAYEPFFIARKGNPKLRKPGRSNVFSYKPVPTSSKYHPTQRPLELMEDILETFAWPKQIVMVPFLGSGATLQAAYRQQMNGFGWELNESNKDHFLLEVKKDDKLK